MKNRPVFLIGASQGYGAQIRACEKGPDALFDGGLIDFLQKNHIHASKWKQLYPEHLAHENEIAPCDILSIITHFNQRLALAVEEALSNNALPVIIGGDHSIAVGSWNGVKNGLNSELPLGLIWIDAHMDSHTPETSPSGAWHGMPLAALLGHGPSELSRLTQEDPILHPEHLCIIGARSYEEGEHLLLQKRGVRIFLQEEVVKRGMRSVMEEAIEIVSKHTVGYGLSIDLDVLDPSEAPGVGSPEVDGLKKAVLLEVLALYKKDPRLLAIELVEYNPYHDLDKKTYHAACDLLACLL